MRVPPPGCPRSNGNAGNTSRYLVGNLGGPRFAHDSDDDLAGVYEVLLDLAYDLAREVGGCDVVYLVRFDEDADLAPRL